MRVVKNPAWIFYLADKDPDFDENKVGKWMYFFADRSFVEMYVKRRLKKGLSMSVNTAMPAKAFLVFT